MVNLIKNSGFEDEPLGVNWTMTNAAVVYDSVAQTHAAKFSPGGKISQTIVLSPGATYSLQFDYRAWSTNPVNVNVGGKELTFTSVILPGYTTVTPQTFTVPASPTNAITFSCANVVFLDRIDLELVSNGAGGTFLRDVHVIESPGCSVNVYKNGVIVGNAKAYAPVSVSLVIGDTWGAQTVVPDTGTYTYEKNCYRDLDTNTYNCVTNEKDYVPIAITSVSTPKYQIDYYFTTAELPPEEEPSSSSSLVYVAAAGLVAVILYKILKKKK